MSVAFAGNAQDVVNAINGFDAGYHLGYRRAATLRQDYLGMGAPSIACATALATALDTVLRDWGAGVRKAPTPLPVSRIASALLQPSLLADLHIFVSNGVGTLSVANGARHAVTGTAGVPALDAALIRTLTALATGMFVNNTNVTYPMKALLLLTGYMPAFDSQVRKGLQRGGFAGMDQTRMLMPTSVVNATHQKVTRLPYLLSDCWRGNPQIREGVLRSNYPWMQDEPGRVFDVLLFMQADDRYPALLQWHGQSQMAWYEVP